MRDEPGGNPQGKRDTDIPLPGPLVAAGFSLRSVRRLSIREDHRKLLGKERLLREKLIGEFRGRTSGSRHLFLF